MNPVRRSFASDNNSGIHPRVLDAIHAANVGHVRGYGDDPHTEKAEEKLQTLFQAPVDVYFTFNGTGANVLGLQTLLRPHQAVICAESAHIHLDECGAPERFTGSKLITVPTLDGKFNPDLVRSCLKGLGDPHHVQPRVISITQSTELGTLYSVAEIAALARFAHASGMYLHVDGARIANAIAALGKPINEVIAQAGVDVLSFGGTKNGIMGGEAVIFFNSKLALDFEYLRKQGMQLASKMRFISAQFDALITDDLWLQNAKHSNAMAALLASEIEKFECVRLARTAVVNSVFAILPPEMIKPLQELYYFYVWNEKTYEVRFVTSFDTQPEDVQGLVSAIRKLGKTTKI